METQRRSASPRSPCSFCFKPDGLSARRGQFARRGLCLVLFGLLASVLATAQTRREATDSPVASPKTETPSPYRIEWLFDINDEIDLKQIWRMLNIEPLTDVDYRCRGNCEAEVFDLDTGDEDRQKTVALRISYEASHFYQYLVFKQLPANGSQTQGWKLLGKIDCRDQRYAPPAHRIEQGDGRTWLVIKESWGRGKERAAHGEAWHEIQESSLKEVLDYPAAGHHQPCRGDLGRSYKSLLLRHGLENGDYTIVLQFMIAYSISDCERPDESPALFAKGQKAYYVWRAEKGRFVLDEARSEVTEKEIARIYGLEGLSDEDFVEANIQELTNLAKSGDARRKAWLKNFLTRMPDTPRRAEFERLLQP